MTHSKDYDELLHYWYAWHEAIGPQLQNKYLRYVQLANRAAKLNGIKSFDSKCNTLFHCIKIFIESIFKKNIFKLIKRFFWKVSRMLATK